ncbi:MAG: hypothetical protein RBT65_06340 [Methanolobus sp.]|nr:hypothetical protein [Methanolobus sp.]
MSIIACTEFEKDIVKLLAEDKIIKQLIVVDGSSSSKFVNGLKQIGLVPHVLFPETIPCGLKKSKGFNVLVTLQDNNSYSSSGQMKREIYEKIKFYGLVSSGILMFYGSCKGIFGDVLLDFRKRKIFLEFLSSENGGYMGDGIDDCFSNNKDMHTPELAEKYRDCYNELKEQILSQLV